MSRSRLRTLAAATALATAAHGTWWDVDETDADGAFERTAPVQNGDELAMRYVILVEIDDRWYYYADGATFGDLSPVDIADATPLRPLDFDADESCDVYAGRALGISDTISSKVCDWNDALSQDVRTASVYWWSLCFTDASIYDARTAHTGEALNGFGNVVFPSRLDRAPTSDSYRLDYFVTADEYTVTDTATGAEVTIVDRGIDVLDETDTLVKVDVEVTVEISGSWARWQVDVFEAGTRIPADDVPFYFVGSLATDEETVWQDSAAGAVSWGGGNDDALVGHRASGFDDWSYADGDDEVIVRAFGELAYEVAVADWCPGGAGDPMADLLATLAGAAFGSSVAQVGGVCDPQATWDFPALTLKVGVPFDQTFTAPTDGIWNWGFAGGILQAYDLPDGLQIDILDTNVTGTPPALRIYGTPTTAGPYRFSVDLRDYTGNEWSGYIPGKVAPATLPGDDDPDPEDDRNLVIDLNFGVGDVAEGSTVMVTAEGLEEGSEYDIEVHSTPQLLGTGTVPVGGVVTRTVTLPKLEPGWHSIIFTGTWAGGSAATGRVWFFVTQAGTVSRISYTLPNTGTDTAPLFLFGTLLLAGGLVLTTARRRSRATA